MTSFSANLRASPPNIAQRQRAFASQQRRTGEPSTASAPPPLPPRGPTLVASPGRPTPPSPLAAREADFEALKAAMQRTSETLQAESAAMHALWAASSKK